MEISDMPNVEQSKAGETSNARPKNNAAEPIRMQRLRKMLDLTRFLHQLEELLSQPIK